MSCNINISAVIRAVDVLRKHGYDSAKMFEITDSIPTTGWKEYLFDVNNGDAHQDAELYSKVENNIRDIEFILSSEGICKTPLQKMVYALDYSSLEWIDHFATSVMYFLQDVTWLMDEKEKEEE